MQKSTEQVCEAYFTKNHSAAAAAEQFRKQNHPKPIDRDDLAVHWHQEATNVIDILIWIELKAANILRNFLRW